MPTDTTTIEIFGTDGSYWPVYGIGAGSRGVRLGHEQVKGLFESPVQTSWTASNLQIGGSMKGRFWEYRDISLGFHILDNGRPWAETYSDFRQAFDYREDDWDHDSQLAKIVVTTPHSGTRWLYVQLYEAPDFNPGVDPLKRKHGNPILPLRAGQPFWESSDLESLVEFTATGTKYVTCENRTNLPAMQKWIVGKGNWTLPDRSWQGKPCARVFGTDKLSGANDSAREIIMPPITALEVTATVDLDPMQIQVRDQGDTNLVGRMPVPGRSFLYVIPPYTPPTQMPVKLTAYPGSETGAKLIVPQRWREPIGGERSWL